MQNEHRVIGMVVQSTPFQDHHQIISLYSAEWGLMRIIIKYAYAKKNPQSVEPLNLVEICLREGKSDLFQSLSVSRLNTYLKLRSSYPILNTGLELLFTIVKSQVYHKSSPILFSLLLKYLDYLPNARFPKILDTSFKLKTLRHDGWLAIVDRCSLCQQELDESQVSEGQFFCRKHSIPHSICFSNEEREVLKLLTHSRSFSELDQNFLSSTLEEKVNSLFAEFIAN